MRKKLARYEINGRVVYDHAGESVKVDIETTEFSDPSGIAREILSDIEMKKIIAQRFPQVREIIVRFLPE